MPSAALATIIHDPDGHLADKADVLLHAATSLFEAGIAAVVTPETDRRVHAALEGVGALIEQIPPDPHRIGAARRQSLALAAKLEPELTLYSDLDHVLRWIEDDRAELAAALRSAAAHDCTVMGRTPSSFIAMSRRMRETESLVNHVWSLSTGLHWDVMIAVRALSPSAVAAIVDACDEESIGNDTAWPLFCRARGLDVTYLEAQGLRYMTEAQWAGGHDDDGLDHDPQAWARRVEIALVEIRAIERWIDG